MDGADTTTERIRIGARLQTPAVLIYVAVWLTASALQRFLDRTAEEKNLGDIPRGTIQAQQQLLAAEAGAVNAWHPVSPVVAEKFVRTTLLNQPGAGGDSQSDPELDQLNRKYLSDESSAQEHMAQVRRSAWPEALLIAAGLGFIGGIACVTVAAIMDSTAWGIPGMLALAAGGLFLWGWSIGGAWIGLVISGCSLGGVSLFIGMLLLLTGDDQELRSTGWLLCLLGGVLVPAGVVAITRWATSRSRAAAELAPHSGI